jgi:hypothetical protein
LFIVDSDFTNNFIPKTLIAVIIEINHLQYFRCALCFIVGNYFGAKHWAKYLEFFHNLPNRFFINVQHFFNFFFFPNRMWQFVINQKLIFLKFDILFDFMVNNCISNTDWVTLKIILCNVCNAISRKCAHINCSCLYNLS